MDDYARHRISVVRLGSQPPMQLRLADGRILKSECIALPDGGRMMTYADISDLVQSADRLLAFATIDDLTKLLNRRRFLELFEDEFSRALRDDRPLSVMMIDADHFKEINDRHGHRAGDVVLRGLADRCRGMVRQGDIVGRVGGEEFAAVLTETDLSAALKTAERLRKLVAAHSFNVSDERLTMTVSVGVAARSARDVDSGELLRLADRALYAAKANGHNRVESAVGK